LSRRHPNYRLSSRTAALFGRKACAILSGNNGFEDINLFKCGLSRCPVKDDDPLSVYAGFCSFQSNRERNLPTWDLLGL